MTSETVIRVENLGKKYIINHQQQNSGKYVALRDVLTDKVKSLFAPKAKDQAQEEFWALSNISFEVKQGEVIGIIGRNGAGKSTLLKILSRITEPTTGRMNLKGRIGSLLEVGTGFHPELTGRENIYLNGAILGMAREEIKQKFDEIVAFAEVEKFLDTPVKRYSSGMYMRLAFAVAAHLDPEILVVDEVLAVGDTGFQKKCLGKMGDVATKEGRTVLFVSHNMTAIKSLCQKAIWLNQGNVVKQGEVSHIVADYIQQGYINSLEKVWSDPASAPGNEKVRLHRVAVCPIYEGDLTIIHIATPIQLIFEYWNYEPNIYLNVSVTLYNLEEVCIFNTFSTSRQVPQGLIREMCYIPGNLLNDAIYRIRVLIVEDASHILLEVDNSLTFEVNEVEREGNWHGKWIGALRPKLEWHSQLINNFKDD